MTEDEMKDRISMALKDPILQQWFIDNLISLEEENAELKEQIEKMQEKLKADLIVRLKEEMQYSTSPSCTKGMELFIKAIEKWEVKENDR